MLGQTIGSRRFQEAVTKVKGLLKPLDRFFAEKRREIPTWPLNQNKDSTMHEVETHIFWCDVVKIHKTLRAKRVFLQRQGSFVLFLTTILSVVTKDLPISPRFPPYNFVWRCKFSTLTSRQAMVEFLLTHVPTLSITKERTQILHW